MRTFLVCAAVVLAVLPLPTTARQPDDVTTIARANLDGLIKGDYAAVIATFNEKMRAAMPEDKLRGLWTAVQAQVGSYQSMGESRVQPVGNVRAVITPIRFERGSFNIQFAFTPAGTVGGFNLWPTPPTTPFADAAYVTPSAFSERDITVNAGGWPLPATLSLPAGKGPFPAIVLVHGSGPNDRDATIGPNKPFRDLSLGLASRGIAVLRYEKRTRQHGAKLASLPNLTVKEETTDDAIAAVRLLRVTAGIDPGRIYVLGHSLGGMLVPRMAAVAGSDVRGWIVLAGPARSLEQALIDQTRYLAAVDGTVSPDEQKQIDAMQDLAKRVNALKGDEAPLSAAGISAPASYWIDLRGYDAPTAARTIRQPMLVLQGERDYQVTTADFNQWKNALGARKDVTLKPYAALNHLFMAGTGRSIPAEYMTAGHVAEEVISDIAAWIAEH